MYTNLGTIYPASGGAMTDYTGYFINAEFSGGAFLIVDFPLSRSLNWDAWNTIDYDGGAGGRLLFNGQDAGAASAVLGQTAKLTLGVRDQGGASGFTVHYDNVVVSVTR